MLRAISLVFVAGCMISSDDREQVANPAQVTDSSGAEFAWQCDAFGDCEVAATTGTPSPPPCRADQTSGYGFVASRFVSIATACDDSWLGSWERPVVCSEDLDCPQILQFSTDYRFACVRGLCQNVDHAAFPSDAIIQRDAFLLCYGPIARAVTIEPGSPEEIDVSTWVNAACPGFPDAPCTSPLPDDCLQP